MMQTKEVYTMWYQDYYTYNIYNKSKREEYKLLHNCNKPDLNDDKKIDINNNFYIEFDDFIQKINQISTIYVYGCIVEYNNETNKYDIEINLSYKNRSLQIKFIRNKWIINYNINDNANLDKLVKNMINNYENNIISTNTLNISKIELLIDKIKSEIIMFWILIDKYKITDIIYLLYAESISI